MKITRFLLLLGKTARLPTTIGWIAGSVLTASILGTLMLIDPPGTHALRPYHLFGLVALHVSFSFFVNFQLVSGRWRFPRWRKAILYFAFLPSLLGFAFVNSLVPKYWPIGTFINFSGLISAVGVEQRWKFYFAAFSHFLGFLVFLYIRSPVEFNAGLTFNLAFAAAGMAFTSMVEYGSRFLATQDHSIRRLLRSSRRDKRAIAEERRKSDRLLLNILPSETAAELKAKGSVTPVHFDSATVLFTDFKGFTTVAESLSAKELVTELDRCFSYFDAVMSRYDLEKLKTIGDSYMCAGGLPIPNKTHPVDCVLAAIEIQAFMNQMKTLKAEQGFPYWELRLGIHSGPLVAGVIGEKKFQYDVWGDTVNTASRMESSGVAGRVNISGATYDLVKDLFVCDYRGKVQAKNKGEIDMYFVNGITAELSRDRDGRVPNEQFWALLQARR